MHTGAAVGQSRLPAHCTQRLVGTSQMGRPAAQLVFERHSTQRCVVVLQAGVAPPHWALLAHCTHRPLGTSQRGACALVQLALVVQGATQTKVRGSQTEVAPPQLALVRQATQRFVEVLHTGVAPLQLESAVHWTHLLAEQTEAVVGQSEAPLHSTHCPVGLQTFPPPQSGEVRQATQLKDDAEQNGLFPPHWAAVVHSAH